MTAATRPDGALESPSTPNGDRSTGRKKAGTTPESGASCAPGSTSRRARRRLNRSDVEVFFNGLPEPIDLEIDLEHRILYWTDRGNPPRGNTVNRAPIDAKPAQNVPQIVVSDLMEGIGIALDVPGNRMFVTDLAGSLYAAKLDGTDKRMLLAAQGNLTGIAYVEISPERRTDMSDNKPIQKIAIIGTGVIGASWAAQFLAKGLDVVATDVAPDAETSLRSS